MSKYKKALVLLLVMAITVSLSVGLTLAYLQDTDDDVNVMTLGNVKIRQHEYERALNDDGTFALVTSDSGEGYKLKEFTQDKPLYPAVGTPNLLDETVVYFDQLSSGKAKGHQAPLTGLNNVQDKFVLVENIGKSSCYVRTIIAYEVGKLTDAFSSLIVAIHNQSWSGTQMDIVEIEGNNYQIVEYVYQGSDSRHIGGIVPAGEYTFNSLAQIYLESKATNEDVLAIDGNGNGKYDILVLSQAMQTQGFADAQTALDTGFGDVTPETAQAWFGETLLQNKADTWDGTVDTSWYNDTDTEFMIMTAEQLAGFSKLVDEGKTFESKTVKVGRNIDLLCDDENGESKCFNPIGSYRNDKAFKGTFDGLDHTISNMHQNTWALDNGYYYTDCGLGLFGLVEDGTIRNLTMDGASISGESAICGTVAACASGDCTFEKITISNCQVADYQYYAGGIVGWASGNHQYIGCKVEPTTIIAAQWGDFDNSTGGVIGGAGGTAEILMKDCQVACRIDAYNDVTSSYQWYAYRRCGMLIGNPGKINKVGQTTVAAAPQLTCENVTVTYGDWANYTYCEFAGTSWPYVRVQAGISNSAYSNPRYGHPTDANGNQVTNDNHVHNDGEDHQILCIFDQLYGGGQGVYGTATHDGVTVIYNNK